MEIAEFGTPPPFTEPRREFRRDLRPLSTVSKEAALFLDVLDVYENSLDSAGTDKSLEGSDEEIVKAAEAIVRGGDGMDQKEIQRVYDWFRRHQSNADFLLSSVVGGDAKTQQDLKNLIAENLSWWITTRRILGGALRRERDPKAIARMGKFLIDRSETFKGLRKPTSPQTDSLLEDVEKITITSTVGEEILRLSPGVPAFEMQEWIRTTGREARAGRRIFETPFYRSLLDKLRFIGRKKNGLGGAILYGPPGTGKTELLQEKNRKQGFKTRVVSIHHYSSYADLVGEKVVSLNIDPGTSFVQKTKIVLDAFADQSPEEFGTDIEAIFNRLRSEGRLGPNDTILDFLSSIALLDMKDVVDEGERTERGLTPEGWRSVRDIFVSSLRGRMLRTALPERYQEKPESLVMGEILLAIENGERVVLDEIDKAGPNSLGGLLGFLALSPGGYIQLGEKQITIPSWFIVDATSNSSELEQYLRDRFSHFEVSTPPVKDQLMIAAVRLSDGEGNILLSDYEQNQFVALFAYVIPQVNALLGEKGHPPISNRGIQEFTSYLVDFGLMERTKVSFSEAVKRFLLESKTWAQDEATADSIKEILARFRHIVEDRPIDLTKGLPSRAVSPEQSDRLKRKSTWAAALKGVVESPLIIAINGLGEKPDPFAVPKITQVSLTDQQREDIRQFLKDRTSRESARRDVKKLPIGFTLSRVGRPGQERLELAVIPERGEKQIIFEKEAGGRVAEIVSTSADGGLLILSTPGLQNNIELQSSRTFEEGSKQSGGTLGSLKDSEIMLDPNGTHLIIRQSKDGNFNVEAGDLSHLHRWSKGSVKRASISKDGKTVLLQGMKDDSARLMLAESGRELARLQSGHWEFIGDHLAVRVGDMDVPEADAVLIK
ncbi:MAG: AAA family ATPase [bacterium]|nr:AAA family ATPase [bacterium]